jgi:NADH:ubiquinone oxidoreductase subunit 2 (subunit N)
MKTVLIILAIIYVAIGLYFWVRNLIIVQTKEKELPEDEKYTLAAKVSGSILLLFMWVIAWPIIIYKVRE